MDGGEDGRGGRVDAAPGSWVTGVAAPPTAWPDGTPAGGRPPLGPPPTRHLPAWGPPVPPAPPGPSRSRGLLSALAVLAVVAAVATALVVFDPLGGGPDESAASWRSDADPEDLVPVDEGPTVPPAETTTTTTSPPPTTTAPPTRLAPAPTAPAASAESGAHTFLGRERDGDPITWDPCETIQYVVNSRTAPPGGAELVAEALAAVSAATGLVFENRGPTDEAPTAGTRPLTDPRYGKGWSPVLIAWTDPDEVSDLAGWIGGWGGAQWVPEGRGEYEAVTGIVHLDGPEVAGWLDRGERTEAAHLLLHEVGHLVGLDHVDDPSQVMYHNRDGRAEDDAAWNAGDLTGLAALGTGTCNPDI